MNVHLLPQKARVLKNLFLQGGFSPLYVASQEGHTDVVDILLKSGADVHQTIIKVCIYAVISLIYACSLVHRIHLPH